MNRLNFYLFFSFSFLGLIFFNRGNPAYGQADNPGKKLTKNIFSLNANFGSSFSKINTGIYATSGRQVINEEIKVGTGGGFGMDAGFGRKLSKHFRFVVNAGFQIANGKPKIADGVIRFSRLLVRPELNFHLPLKNDIGLELGLGGYLGFNQKLKIQEVSTNQSDPIYFNFKESVGATSHLYYVHSADNNQFFAGLRLQWLNLEFRKATYAGQAIDLTMEDKKRFDDQKGDGLSFVVGMRFLF